MAGADEVKNLMLQVDASVELARRNLRSLVGEVDRFQRSTDAALDKADKDFAQFGGGISKAAGSMRGLIAGAFTGAALIQFGKSAVQATQQFRGFEQALKIVTGSTAAASQELDYVAGVADRIGFKVTELAGAYVGLSAASRGTTLEGQRTRDIFEAITSAAAAYGLTNEQLEGSLLAVQQMISKGTVSAEELRGQLGERLPGAFQIAARAMGVTTSELDDMLKKGEVVAGDFLPKFVAQLQKEVPAGTEAAGAGFARLANEWSNFLRVVGDDLGLFDALAAGARNLASAIGDINAQLQGSERISRGKGFGGALDVFLSSKQTLEQSATPTGHAAALRNRVGTLQAELRDKLRRQSDAGAFGDWYNPDVRYLRGQLKDARAELAAYLASPEYQEAKSSLSGNLGAPPAASTGGGGGSSKPEKTPKTKVSALARYEDSTDYRFERLQEINDFVESTKEIELANVRIGKTITFTEYLGESFGEVADIVERDVKLAFDEWIEQQEELQQAAEDFARTFAGAFEEAILSGDLDGALDGLLEDMARLIIRLTVIEPLAKSVASALKGGGGGGGLLGGIISGIGALFGGPRASGGPVQAGTTYLVGEKGPELFRPRFSGEIVANDNLRAMSAGGSTTIAVSVDARGATDPAMVEAAALRAVYAAAPAIINASNASTRRGLQRRVLPRGRG